METDPPAEALEAAIGHGNEVAGINNDGGKASGEDLNEYGEEASGEEVCLPKPNAIVLYILFGFGFGRLSSSPGASPPYSLRSSPDAFPPPLLRVATSFP